MYPPIIQTIAEVNLHSKLVLYSVHCVDMTDNTVKVQIPLNCIAIACFCSWTDADNPLVNVDFEFHRLRWKIPVCLLQGDMILPKTN